MFYGHKRDKAKAVIGAVSGGVSAGIGWVATNRGASFFETIIAQGVMHGWSGSMVAMLHGSNPGTGYVSRFFSSITSSAVQNLGGGKVATVIGGGLTGGVGAAVSGGNFFQGATYGLIASSLNHIAHEILVSTSAGPGDPPTKEQLEIRMYEEYAAGRCSQIEYLYSLDVINNNPLGMVQNLWEFHKVEIGVTAAGMGFTKFLSLAAKWSAKLLNQFNCAESLIQGAGNLTKVKAGMQGFVKGDGPSIFNSITQGGKLQSNGQYLMQNGMQIGNHFSKTTGA
ncbi:MAG: hypothetical protein LC107_06435 [Chitinophagales bacterium]|nr:hypothetical protein [Chitinophagales bacterium]